MDFEHNKFLELDNPTTTTMNDTATPPPATLADIANLTGKLQEAHTKLCEAVTEMNHDIELVRQSHLSRLKRCVARAKELRSAVIAAIESTPALFIKPKSLILHGIKVGFKKLPDGILITDEATTIDLITTHCPELLPTLVRTTEALNKKHLATLPPDTLQQIGVSIEPGAEETMAVPVDSNVDRLVKALMADEPETDAA